MKKIRIETSRPYDAFIGENILENAGTYMRESNIEAKKAFIVSDDTVLSLYGLKAKKSLESAGYKAYTLAFEHGEKHKTLATVEKILSTLVAAEITRGDVLVALGGGVVGDVCGFCAAIYLRGVQFVQVPTTLLAAVDSSVGGKTGVDLPHGKNLVGAFHQPVLVLCDTGILNDLPAPLYAEGMAEVVKYGVIRDKAFFDKLAAREISTEEIVEKSVCIKADIVKNDEFDRGERMLLNFGHTFAHAVEKASGFTLSHGESVAIGMCIAAEYAEKTGFCEGVSKPLAAVLSSYGLPTENPFEKGELFGAMTGDKKRFGDDINLILPSKIGRAEIVKTPLEVFKERFFAL